MAKLEDWREWAHEHKGNTVVWINQSGAANLKAANSEGVCKAITLDWVSSYRKTLADRSKFVNQFRSYDKDGKLQTCVPDAFMEKQDEYWLEKTMGALDYKEALQNYLRNRTPEKQRKLDEVVRRTQGSPDCKRFWTFSSIDEVLKILRALTKSYYFELGLSRQGGAHVIGFEFRPDKKVSNNFPKLYEYIDANTGLFVFATLKDMIDFVELKVLPRNDGFEWKKDEPVVVWPGYGAYTKFTLRQYDIGLDGAAAGPQELDKDLADRTLVQELEKLEKDAETKYGKDWWK
jgi:hypothetical protein